MKNEKAVALAKDVLARLSLLKLTHGVYCMSETHPFHKVDGQDDAQKHLPTLEKECDVCALGACFLSYIRLYDNVNVANCKTEKGQAFVSSHFMREKLGEVFSCEELGLIEAEWEGFGDELGFYPSYADPTERLAAIMQHIVDNGGEIKAPEEEQEDN